MARMPECVQPWTRAWSTLSRRTLCWERSGFACSTQLTGWSGRGSSRQPRNGKKLWKKLRSEMLATFQSLVWMQHRYWIPSPPSDGFSKPAARTCVYNWIIIMMTMMTMMIMMIMMIKMIMMITDIIMIHKFSCLNLQCHDGRPAPLWMWKVLSTSVDL